MGGGFAYVRTKEEENDVAAFLAEIKRTSDSTTPSALYVSASGVEGTAWNLNRAWKENDNIFAIQLFNQGYGIILYPETDLESL